MPIISGPTPKDVLAAVDSVFTRTGAVVAASNDYTLNQIGNATADYSLSAHRITGLANGTAATDALAVGQVLAANVIPVADLVAGTAGQVLGGTGPGYSLPPGFEINYTQITSNANVTDTSEATATALISPGAIVFDGTAVIVEFFCAAVLTDTAAAGDQVVISLFEGASQITRLAALNSLVTTQHRTPVHARYRFTPTAASHTYKITAFTTSATGTPTLSAGAGGTATFPPAFVRFVKV